VLTFIFAVRSTEELNSRRGEPLTELKREDHIGGMAT
jgi:hypothetical protein